MIETCFWHVWDMFKAWLRHVFDMFEICLRHDWDIFLTCLRHDWDMFLTCLRHVFECIVLQTIFLSISPGEVIGRYFTPKAINFGLSMRDNFLWKGWIDAFLQHFLSETPISFNSIIFFLWKKKYGQIYSEGQKNKK